ncbi:hypothetical protein DFH09DRAFT_892893, partial [Mycena vulgaris]
LQFSINWDQKRIDKWFRALFPLLFEYLDHCYPGDAASEYRWVLLGKDQRTLFLMDRKRITGAELDISKGPTRRKFTDHVVRFGAFL